MMKSFLILTLLVGSTVASAFDGKGGEVTLRIDDPAPTIQVQKWLRGQALKTAGPTPGKVTVLEFWATWCSPCVAAIPHLIELQEKYGKDGLEVIGMATSESEETGAEGVDQFLKENFPNLNYRIAFNPESGKRDLWMDPAGENGIPTAFVIDREGKIAYIGHGASVGSVIESVLNGTWNGSKEKAAHIAARKKGEADDKVIAALTPDLEKARDEKNWSKVIELYDSLIALKAGNYFGYQIDRAQVLLFELKDARGFDGLESVVNATKDISYFYVKAMDLLFARDLDTSVLESVRRFELGRKYAEKILELEAPGVTEYAHYYFPSVAQYYFEAGNKEKAIELLNLAVTAIGDKPDEFRGSQAIAEAMAEYTGKKFCLGSICTLPPAPKAASKLAVGDSGPKLDIKQWVRKDHSLDTLGGGITIVEFWATWCAPCVKAIPEMIALKAKYGARGLNIIGVAASEDNKGSAETVDQYLKEKFPDINYDIGFLSGDEAEKTKVAWLTASGQKGIPSTFIINQAGKVSYIWYGAPSEKVIEMILDGTWEGSKEQAAHLKRRGEVAAKDALAAEQEALIKKYEAEKNWPKVLEAYEVLIKAEAGNYYGYLTERANVYFFRLKDAAKGFEAIDALMTALSESSAYGARSALSVLFSRTEDTRSIPHEKRFELGKKFAETVLATEAPGKTEHAYYYYPPVAQYFYEAGDKAKAIELLKLAVASIASEPDEYAEAAPIAEAMAEYTGEKFCLGSICALPPAPRASSGSGDCDKELKKDK